MNILIDGNEILGIVLGIILFSVVYLSTLGFTLWIGIRIIERHENKRVK